MSKFVVIMRGIPGSGKDTYLRKRFGDSKLRVVSADDFFIKGGRYFYDPTKVGEAHAACYKAFLAAIHGGYLTIAVNNTNVHRWEYENYVFAAGLLGYAVEIVEMQVETIDDARLCARRNVHGVPMEVVARMALEFEPCSRATKVKISSDSNEAGAIYPCKDEE